MPIVNNTVNALAATVLPNAPVDPVTGLKVPTIAVATGGGISVIQNSGTVRNSSSTSAFTAITLTPQLLSAGRADTTWYSALNPGALGASFALTSETSSAAPDFNVGNTTVLRNSGRSTLARSSSAVIQLLRNNEATIGRSAAAKLSNTFNAGWLLGDIRRAYLSDSVTGSLTGPELVTNGDFSNGTTGWLAGSFSSLSVEDGKMKVTATETNVSVRVGQVLTVVVGKTYKVTSDINPCTIREGTFPFGLGSNQGTIFTANTTTASVYVGVSLSAGQSYYVDNISVREVIPDRSYKAAGANIYGTITATPVANGASLVAYSGFSS